VRGAAGSDSVNLLGYCSSGVVTLLYGARHAEAPLRSLTNIATPVDFSRWPLVSGMFAEGRLDPETVLDDTGNVSASALRNSFRLLNPTYELRQYTTLLENLWNDQYVDAYRAMTKWDQRSGSLPRRRSASVRGHACPRQRVHDGPPRARRRTRQPAGHPDAPPDGDRGARPHHPRGRGHTPAPASWGQTRTTCCDWTPATSGW